MLTYLETNLLSSPAQTLVNTVNTEGVMGKGIAKQFKEKFPEMFPEYKQMCDNRKLQIGNLHLWRGRDKWILNFPTKTTWKMPSRFEYIENGLKKFVSAYEKLGIVSISFPRLGCGNGQLDWDKEIKPLMEKYLGKLPISVYVHNVQTNSDFIPEHQENTESQMPVTLNGFFSDIGKVLLENKGSFKTFSGSSYFEANLALKDHVLKITRGQQGKSDTIPEEALISAWSTLQSGILSVDQFSDDTSSRYTSYLFPVLAELPYIQVIKISNSSNENPRVALLLKPDFKPSNIQGKLW